MEDGRWKMEDDDDFGGFLGSPVFVLERYDLLPEYRDKRLGHLALQVGLQTAGCEDHSLFIHV